MRTILFLLVCSSVGCDDAPSAAEPAQPPSETTPGATAETAPETPPAPLATTTGFIQATIGGEVTRFEHLPANDNRVVSRATVLAAHTGPERRHGIRIILSSIDIRDEEFPATFQRDVAAAMRGDLAAASRMAALNYMDADGKEYAHIFGNDELQCQSFEDFVLKCTFSATANSSEGGSVEFTDGSLEVLMTTDSTADAIIDGTVGAAADVSQERVQEVLDRLNKRREERRREQ